MVPSHPQTDPQTERMDAVLENLLRHETQTVQHIWVNQFPLAQLATHAADNIVLDLSVMTVTRHSDS